MKVSILIPTLNRLAFLEASLTSACCQTHDELEILVSDDGSIDGTVEYVRGVAKIDPRVRLLPRNPKPGLFTNVNYLIQASTGDAFCMLADDDLLHPEFVARLVAPLEQNDQVAAAFCDHWIMNAAGQVLQTATDNNSRIYHRTDLPSGPVADALSQVMRGSMCMGFSLYRAQVFRAEPFDLSCGGAADFDYAIRAARRGQLYYVKRRLGYYRDHATTTTATRPAFMIDGIIRVFSKYSFAERRHETMRREILRSKFRIRALYSCVIDRREYLRNLDAYLRLAGNPFHPKILMSLLLAAMPRASATRIKASMRQKAIVSRHRLVRAALAN